MNETPTIEELRECFPGRKIQCVKCGNDYIASNYGRNRKYCPPCALEVRRERDRFKHKQARDKDRSSRLKQKADIKPKRISQIDNLAAAARAAGMSYGRYVALREAGRI